MTISYKIHEFRIGLKIIQDSEPCEIISHDFVKPGKGQAFNRVRMRKIISGKIFDKTFKSKDFAKSANVINISLIYLYHNNGYWYFTDKEIFERFAVDEKIIGKNFKWLSKQEKYLLTLWDGKPISVIPPNFVELEIIKTDANTKGNTIGNNEKYAILNTGATVKVPSFIKIGEIIKVDTRSGEYISRVK